MLNIERLRTRIKTDILLNCFSPVVFGSFIYLFAGSISFPLLLRNYMADGLWAYAFCSAFLIIWNRKIPFVWTGIAFLSAVVFEGLQYLHFIQGSGDLYDVITYFLSFALSIALNTFFKHQFNY